MQTAKSKGAAKSIYVEIKEINVRSEKDLGKNIPNLHETINSCGVWEKVYLPKHRCVTR